MIINISYKKNEDIITTHLNEEVTYASIMNQVNANDGIMNIDSEGRLILQLQDIREVEIPWENRQIFYTLYQNLMSDVTNIENIILISDSTQEILFDMTELNYSLEKVRLFDRGLVGEILADGTTKMSILLQIVLIPKLIDGEEGVE